MKNAKPYDLTNTDTQNAQTQTATQIFKKMKQTLIFC